MSSTFDPNAAAAPDSGLFGLSCSPAEANVHVIPVPFDATTSYRKGTARGPEAMLAASHQIDLFDRATGKPYEAGITMLAADERIERWNEEATRLAQPIIDSAGADADAAALERINAIGAELNAVVADATRGVLAEGKLPCVLGGDHSTPFGGIQACAELNAGLGILHIDAHADLRRAYEGFEWSHASIFDNVLERVDGVARILQVGVRDLCQEEHDRIEASEGRVVSVFDDEWSGARFDSKLPELVRDSLECMPREIWVSFDIDGLEPNLCPSTGTPVPGGLSWSEALLWLDELVRSGRRIVGFDLSEVSPGPAGDAQGAGDSWDAIVGARLLYRLIGTALQTR